MDPEMLGELREDLEFSNAAVTKTPTSSEAPAKVTVDARLSAALAPSLDSDDEDLLTGEGGGSGGAGEGSSKGGKSYKMVLIGDSNTGKTSICKRFATHSFPVKYQQTMGVEFYSRRVTLPKGVTTLLQLWDVGGNNLASTSLLNMYLHGAQAVLFVYDVTNTQSFENLNDWIQFAKKLTFTMDKPFYMCLVGNKTDNEHRRMIRVEKHNKTAEQHGMNASFYVAAKTGDSIDLMFRRIAAELRGVTLPKAEQESGISVVQAHIPIEAHPMRQQPAVQQQPSLGTQQPNRAASSSNLVQQQQQHHSSANEKQDPNAIPTMGGRKNGPQNSGVCAIQ